MVWQHVFSWWIHCTIGGGLLLALATVAMRRTQQPALRQRIGELGLLSGLAVACLCVGPAWLVLAWSFHAWTGAKEHKVVVQPEKVRKPLPPQFAMRDKKRIDFPDKELPEARDDVGPGDFVLAVRQAVAPKAEEQQEVWIDDAAVEPEAPEVRNARADSGWLDWWRGLWAALGITVVVVYVCGVMWFGVRLLLGVWYLAGIRRSARPAPPDIQALVETGATCLKYTRILVSEKVRVPVSFGFLRPTIVLPVSLCEEANAEKLRWILCHELTHVRRRDSWSGLLCAFAQMLFFHVPWFWSIRRQVRLCQEYVADAAAINGDEQTPEYAEFLLSLTSAPAIPMVATGVSGSSSDLFRRVSMLLEKPVSVQQSCSRRCLIFAALGFVTLAALLGGVGTRAKADGPTIIIINPGQKPKIVQVGDKKFTPKVFGMVKLPKDAKWHFARGNIAKALKDAKVEVEVVVAPKVVGTKGKKLFLLKKKGGDITLWLTPEGQAKKVKVIRVPGIKLNTWKAKGQPGVLVVPSTKGTVRLWETKGQPHQHFQFVPGDDKKVRVKVRLFEPKSKVIEKMVEKLKTAKSEEEIQKIVKEMLQKLQGAAVWPKVAPRVVVPGQKLNTIPSDKFRLYLEKEKTSRGYLGIRLDPETKISEALADQLGLAKGQGVLVAGVVPDSPAAKAGLKRNDVLIQVAGNTAPRDVKQFTKLVAGLDPKKSVDLVIIRKGKRKTIRGIKLGTRDTIVRGAKQNQKQDLSLQERRLQELQLQLQQAREAVERAKKAQLKARKVKQALEQYKKALRGTGGTTNEILMSVKVDGNKVGGQYQKGRLVVSAKGTIEQGMLSVNSIVVRDGQRATVYDGFDDVPVRYADEVRKLLGAMKKSGNVQKE